MIASGQRRPCCPVSWASEKANLQDKV